MRGIRRGGSGGPISKRTFPIGIFPVGSGKWPTGKAAGLIPSLMSGLSLSIITLHERVAVCWPSLGAAPSFPELVWTAFDLTRLFLTRPLLILIISVWAFPRSFSDPSSVSWDSDLDSEMQSVVVGCLRSAFISWC